MGQKPGCYVKIIGYVVDELTKAMPDMIRVPPAAPKTSLTFPAGSTIMVGLWEDNGCLWGPTRLFG